MGLFGCRGGVIVQLEEGHASNGFCAQHLGHKRGHKRGGETTRTAKKRPTDLILCHQILEERRIPARRKRREPHPQDPVRIRGVETGRFGNGNKPLVRGRQSSHGDCITIEIPFDISGAILHSRHLPLRCAALIILRGERAALIAGASGARDEEVGTTSIELDREGLRSRSGADLDGTVVLLVEIR